MHDLNTNKLIGLKIILVDDSLQFRSTLKKLLESQYNSIVIAEASNGEEFLNLPLLAQADIIIMDLMMPKLDGYEAMERINWMFPFIKVIALTMQSEHAYLRLLIEKGFKGCLLKYNIYENLAKAIVCVMEDKLYFPPEFLESGYVI
jgi:DNA-binding NarL/FixJ family response regulator